MVNTVLNKRFDYFPDDKLVDLHVWKLFVQLQFKREIACRPRSPEEHVLNDEFNNFIDTSIEPRSAKNLNRRIEPFHIINDTGNKVGILRYPVFYFIDVVRGQKSQILLHKCHDFFCFMVSVINSFRKQKFFLVRSLFLHKLLAFLDI